MEKECFIFSWPGHEDNAYVLENSHKKFFNKTTVIHSGPLKKIDPNLAQEWVKLSDGAYFGDQFKTAMDIFNSDIFYHIQADVTEVSEINEIVESIENAFYNEVGIWSCDLTYTGWTLEIAAIPNKHIDNPLCETNRFVNVTNTDCTCWAISNEVIKYYKENINLYSHLGWGIDLIMCAIARHLNKFVVKDKNIKLNHKIGTGYSTLQATKEYLELVSKIPNNLRHDIEFVRELENIKRKN